MIDRITQSFSIDHFALHDGNHKIFTITKILIAISALALGALNNARKTGLIKHRTLYSVALNVDDAFPLALDFVFELLNYKVTPKFTKTMMAPCEI